MTLEIKNIKSTIHIGKKWRGLARLAKAQVLVFILIFGGLGTYMVLHTLADTSTTVVPIATSNATLTAAGNVVVQQDNTALTSTSNPNVESLWGCTYDAACGPFSCAAASRIQTLTTTDPTYGNITYRQLSPINGDAVGTPGTIRCELGQNESRGGTGNYNGTFWLYKNGTHYITSWLERITPSVPLANNPNFGRDIIMQMKVTQPYNNPINGGFMYMSIWKNQWEISDFGQDLWQSSSNPPIPQFQNNTWTSISWDVVYSTDPSTGSIQVTIDGVKSPLFHIQTIPTAATPSALYKVGDPMPEHLRMGLYTGTGYNCQAPNGCSVDFANVTVSTPSTSTTPPPTVSLTATPSTINSGQNSTLSWSSTNASSCTASGSWSGTKPTSGSASTGNLSASSNYVLKCTGSGGSAQASSTVTVNSITPPPPPPTVSLSASPTVVNSGSSSSLTWSSTNASSCTASGSWSGTKPTSGSASTGSLSSTSTFNLSCTGGGGTAQASAGVSVNPSITPPSTPTGLHSTNVSSKSVSLSWNPSTDGTNPPSGYYVVRNGATISQTVSPNFTDTTVQPGQTYSYQVIALDSSGNTSGLSSSVSVTTPVQSNPNPPLAPTGLSSSAVSSSQINLSWNTSPDNSILGYHVYRDGTEIATVSTNSLGDTGLSASTSYSYYVTAYNNVGPSSPSATVSATTLASSGGGGGEPHKNGQISGKVSSSGHGLGGAEVVVVYNGSNHYFSTNNEGHYVARDVPAGGHIIIRFFKHGFYSKSYTVGVKAKHVSKLNVSLSRIIGVRNGR